MAVELARFGVPMRIVDKAPCRSDKSKALVIWSRTLELIDRMGCSASFLAAGCKVSAVNIVSGTKQIIHLALRDVATPHPYALMLPQSETERLLEEHLNALGVRVERSVELKAFEALGEGITATLGHPGGRDEIVEAGWLIGCDGAHSTVRHKLGMVFAGDTLPMDWILADAHLSGVRTTSEVDLAWHADGVLAIFPISRDRFRVVADVGPAKTEGPRADPTLEEVQAILDRRGPGGIQASEPVWLSSFRINERKVADYRAGRVFLAGDAAHVHSPAGGQGMNTGIQDACNLAWKLALVCRGTCTEEPLLDSYSAERSAVGTQVLKETGQATALAILRGGIQQAVRNHVASLLFGLSSVQKAAANTVTEISVGYGESPLNAQAGHFHGGPDAGSRAPVRANEHPVGAGSQPKFVLFAAVEEQTSELAARYPDLLEPAVRKPFSEGALTLVRPDGYVALSAKAGAFHEVAAYFDQHCAASSNGR